MREFDRIKIVPFAVVVAAAFVALAASGVPSPLYALYQKEFGLGAGQTSFVYAVYAAGVVVPLLLFGGISDRFGRKPVLIFALCGLFLSSVMFSVSNQFVTLACSRLVQGVSIGLITGVVAPLLGELVGANNRHIAAFANSAATTLGIAFGSFGSSVISEAFGKSTTVPFIVLSISIVVLIVAVCFLIAETVTPLKDRSLRNLVRVQGIHIPKVGFSGFALGSCGIFLAWSVGGLFLALGGAVIHSSFNTDNLILAGITVVCVQGVGGITQLFLSSRKNGVPVDKIMILGLVCLGIGLIVASMSLIFSIIVGFFLGATIAGIGFGMTFMSSTAKVQSVAPEDKVAGVMAAYFCVGYVGISVPALVCGMLARHYSLATVMVGFTIIAIVLISLTVVGLLISQHSFNKSSRS